MSRFKPFAAAALLLLPLPAADKLPAGRGRDTVTRVCGRCHALDVVAKQAHTRAEWSDIVNEMMNYGARASGAQKKQILDYLARTYPRR